MAGKKRNAADLTKRNEQAVNRRINNVAISSHKAHTALKTDIDTLQSLWEAAIDRIAKLEHQVAELESRPVAAIPGQEE